VPGAELAWHLFGPEQINPPDPDEIEGEIVAFISEARWVANCPDSRCNAAQVVSPADPRYVCCVCGNIANHRRWYRVVFPAETTRKEVEQLLLARPRIEHMNWLPHETVADVRTLNTEQRAR